MRGYAGIARMIVLAGTALALAGSAVTAASTSRHPPEITRSSYYLAPSDPASPPRLERAGLLGSRSALLHSAPGESVSPPQASAASQMGPVIDKAAEAALLYRITHTPVDPSYRLYVTRPGDTVESIAQRFHDVAWLIRRRNGGLWHLTPGMRIYVWQWPFDTSYWAIRTTRTDRPRTYTIRSGDSLWSIAGKLHTTSATLASENGIAAGATIYAGQRLVLHHYTVHRQRAWIPGVSASTVHTGLLLTDMANLVRTDAALVKALVWHESGWRMEAGASGEIGMVQIMPQTALWVQRNLIGYALDPRVPANNALLGTVLLAYYLDINHRDTHRALALYHSGNMVPNKRNGAYIRAILGLRAYFYHHPRVGF